LFRREAANSATKALPTALQRFWGNQQSMDLLITVRRGFHTIKGDARVTAASAPPDIAVELEGLAVLSEAAEDIIDYLLGDDYDTSQPAPALPAGAFSLMNETASALARRLEIRRPLDNEAALLKRLEQMQRKAAAQSGVAIDDASLSAKIPMPVARPAAAFTAAPQVTRSKAPTHSLLLTFLEEAGRLMSDLHRALGVLSSNPTDEGALLLARRKLHTLKGGAALIGDDALGIQTIAHNAEDLFELIEDFQLRGELNEVPKEVLDGVLDAEDTLQALLDDLRRSVGSRGAGRMPMAVPAGLVERLQEITERVRRGEVGRQRVVAPEAAAVEVAPAREREQIVPVVAAEAPRAAPDSTLLQRVVVPPLRKSVASVAGLREVSFRDLIEQSDQALPRSRTAVLDRTAAVERRAHAATMPFTLFVGVQQISQYVQDQARYRALAGERGQLYVFGQLDVTPTPEPQVIIVPLEDGDALMSERFAIYDATEHAAACVARDTADEPEMSGRRFLSLSLEDPVAVRAAAARLRAALRQDASLIAVRRIGLQDAGVPVLAPLPRLHALPTHTERSLPVEQARRRTQGFGKDHSVKSALGALEDLSVTRDALQALVTRMTQQRVESRRSGLRLRTLVERVGTELAGLRSELVRTTRRIGDWDLLEKEEYTTVDVLLMQLDEALADLEESDNNLRRDLGEARAQVEIQADKALSAQRALLDMSMIPLSQIEDRLAHAVRSQSRRLKKQVDFRLEGGELVLDGRIAEALFEPMMHLINNALDHGIEESTAARVGAGKTPEGHLTIRGRASGDGVAIDIIDDGRGIDPERMAAVAVARGVVTGAEAAAMTKEERIALIWRPGFSTASTVTAMSGRGIGMKSALDDISALQGRIGIHSLPGLGTTFTVTLPRSLAMLRVEVVREGRDLVAIPITQMVATHSVPYRELDTLEPGQPVQAGNKTLTVFGVQLAGGPARDGEAGRATLLEVADRNGAIVVDEVMGSQYLPVSTAPGYLRRHCGVLGYAVGGGGHILPILDLPTLIERSAAHAPVAIEPPAARRAYNVLVVDDSQTMRRAIRDTLTKAGFNVEEATDGREALTICIRQMPDLITLDMEMPGMDGLEALTALRLLSGGGATVPVFMITSRQQARHRAAALAAGVTRYFTKPYDTDELIGAAHMVLAEGAGQSREVAS
ncbi:MAG: hypothetical protein JWO42_3560, partial [Chloroflexi bacterium]|nr:hypothetical protein [Chloroflexota bacterium]